MDYILVILLLIPILGAIGCIVVPARSVRYWALFASLLTLLVAIIAGVKMLDQPTAATSLWFGPDRSQTLSTSLLAIPSIGFSLSLGVDSISMWLVLLTAFLTPPAILSSFSSIKTREKEYYGWMMLLLCFMMGVFVARDLLLFYIFFEMTLVPMFFIIGIWGGPERRRAAGKFFLFTFAGSIFTLIAVIWLGLHSTPSGPSFNLEDVIRYAQTLPPSTRYWLALGLLAGFAVKVPLFPVHTWLPLAHTEAPTAGSVILAGVLLKLGTYGIMRLALPISIVTAGGGVTSIGLVQAIGLICIIGIIYGALVAWVQKDIKKLVAYSSVSHLGFCVLGLVALNDYGMQGSVLYMINHGLSTGAMFLVIGMIYDRFHTRDINALSGLGKVMPKLAFFFVFFVLASIGLPGLNGFVSEFLTILGAFTSDYLGIAYGSFAALGIVLGAVYMLHMTARVIFGPLKGPGLAVEAPVDHGGHQPPAGGAHGASHASGHSDHGDGLKPGTDIGGREIALLVPIALAVLFFGVLPTGPLRSILNPVEKIRVGEAPVDGQLSQNHLRQLLHPVFPVDGKVDDDDRPTTGPTTAATRAALNH